MKKHLSIFAILFILFILNSCYRGPHTIIAFRNNDKEVKVEYVGTLTCDPNCTRIVSISHDGFLKYNNDGRKIYAENNPDGQLVYKLGDDDKSTDLNDEGKALLTEAVRIIAKQQGRIK